MQEYLSYQFADTEAFVRVFDEMPLWSAHFGMLLLQHVTLKKDMVVADVGCGAGFPLLELAERLGTSSKLYGIDPWTNAVNRARYKVEQYGIKNVELLDASAERMPFEDGYLDLIVSNLGVNNFEHAQEVLKECRRVLKPGGKIAITTNLRGHWDELYRVFEGALVRTGNEDLMPALQQEEQHRATKEGMVQLLSDAGFTVRRMYEDRFVMRFVDGTAFLNHHFIKLGWLTSWVAMFPADRVRHIFAALEDDLNALANERGELALTVPMLFIEGER